MTKLESIVLQAVFKHILQYLRNYEIRIWKTTCISGRTEITDLILEDF